MLRRPLRRAVALSLGALLAFAGTAAADSVLADADILDPVVQGSRHLGDAAPGAVLSADVRFRVVCAGIQHVDAGQSVVLSGNGGTVPLDGVIVSVSTATLTPLAIAWGADGEGCPDPVPAYDGDALSRVVLRAPTSPGIHQFTIVWSRSLSPQGSNDANAFGRALTSVAFTVRVVANTPPTLTVPDSFAIEGDTLGGGTAAWTVTASDAEDDPDPTPTCSPIAGIVLPVGTTSITCSVTDTAGASANATFEVTVTDRKAPSLSGVPADISVTTADPSGRVVDYPVPTAIDVVDGPVSVSCDPSTGVHLPVGTSTVTCLATDGHGNSASASFQVHVSYQAPSTASATWLEPVAGGGSTFVANRGRTVPLKVKLAVDGIERSSGRATVQVAACDCDTAVELPLAWGGGRWSVGLDTSMLAGSCHTVTAWIDGLAAGSFTLEMRGDTTERTSKRPAR